jgi:hypothetical protein
MIPGMWRTDQVCGVGSSRPVEMVELTTCGIERGARLYLPCHPAIASRLRMPGFTMSQPGFSSPPLSGVAREREIQRSRKEVLDFRHPLHRMFYRWMAATFYVVLPTQENVKVGESLRSNQDVWDQLFPNSWASERVRFGFDFLLERPPVQDAVPKEVPEWRRALLRPLKADQLQKGICHIVPGRAEIGEGKMYLLSFPIPKSVPGKYRDVINGNPLNEFMTKQHFKGEGALEYLASLQEGDWQATSDFEDWFNHGKLATNSQPFSRTTLDGIQYEYSSVTFGFHPSPLWMQSLSKPPWALLRSLGIRFAGQCDDWAWIGRSYMDCLVASQVGLGLSTMLGFVLSRTPGKLSLIPSRKVKHLGFITDTVTNQVFLQQRRVQRIQDTGRQLLSENAERGQVRMRSLASFVGMLASAKDAVSLQRARTVELTHLLSSELAQRTAWDGWATMSPPMISQVVWWTHNIETVNGRDLRMQEPTVEVVEDASATGWGGHITGTDHLCWGFWDSMFAGAHSTVTEVNSAINVSKSFIKAHQISNVTVRLRSDASTAVSYFNKQGGRMLHLAKPVAEFLIWCWETHKIQFVSTHIKGSDNNLADYLSRKMNPWTEVALAPAAFDWLESIWGPHSTDLMASAMNTKVLRYFAWMPDPEAAAIDSLRCDWDAESNPYIFPPDVMVMRVLQKVQAGRASRPMTIVTPLWTAQPWIPLLLEMSSDWPRLLESEELVKLPPVLEWEGAHSPYRALVAWRISTSVSSRRDFRSRASSCFSPTGKEGHKGNIKTEVLNFGSPSAESRTVFGRILHQWISVTG